MIKFLMHPAWFFIWHHRKSLFGSQEKKLTLCLVPIFFPPPCCQTPNANLVYTPLFENHRVTLDAGIPGHHVFCRTAQVGTWWNKSRSASQRAFPCHSFPGHKLVRDSLFWFWKLAALNPISERQTDYFKMTIIAVKFWDLWWCKPQDVGR